MGRKKLNRPIEELVGERKERQMRYYYKHRDEIKQKNLDRYHKSKETRDIQDIK
jgi:hypothetical protein